MAVPPRASADLRDFPGIIANMDPTDIPDGAADDQLNACSIMVGELAVRRGLREVTFEEFT